MINYKPLWIQLINRNMTKTQFRVALGISTATLARMSKNEYISLETIEKICQYFDCKVEDVVEFEKDNQFVTDCFFLLKSALYIQQFLS